MKKKTLIIFVTLFAFFSITTLAISQIPRKAKDDLYAQIELFSYALTTIQSDYVDELQAKDLIYGSLKGMLASLDPHSQFLDPDEYKELKTETQGKFGGLGIEISIRDGLLTIITPIEDTQFVGLADFAGEAHAPRTKYAALLIEDHTVAKAYDFMFFNFALVHLGIIKPIDHVIILKFAFTSLIANGAIQRVIDQVKIKGPLYRVFYFFGVGVDNHSVCNRSITCDLKFWIIFDFNHAHATRPSNTQPLMPAIVGNGNIQFLGRVNDGCDWSDL